MYELDCGLLLKFSCPDEYLVLSKQVYHTIGILYKYLGKQLTADLHRPSQIQLENLLLNGIVSDDQNQG
jgi:hypothetical protein